MSRKPLSEAELLNRLGLESGSNRLRIWANFGLPYATKGGKKYFDAVEVEGFLNERYGITSLADFRHRLQEKEELPYVSAWYTS